MVLTKEDNMDLMDWAVVEWERLSKTRRADEEIDKAWQSFLEDSYVDPMEGY